MKSSLCLSSFVLLGTLVLFSCGAPLPERVEVRSKIQRITQGQSYPFSVHVQASEAGSLHVSVISEAKNQTLLEQEQQINPGNLNLVSQSPPLMMGSTSFVQNCQVRVVAMTPYALGWSPKKEDPEIY